MRFDVRAPEVDVEWYADVLRDAPHANEITRVTIRIVEWPELARTCSRSALACYSPDGRRGLLVVPAGHRQALARTLLHEYGHHIDASQRHSAAREPNGSRLWWRARGMANLASLGYVARSYRLGWNRSIAEVFAEDYAHTSVGGPYRIGWLRPPGDTIQSAIRADLGLEPAPSITPPPLEVRPVVIERSGTLAPNTRASVPFGLLGPNRRVTFTASLSGPARAGARTRLEVECNGTVRSRTIAGSSRSATLDLPRAGPAECRAILANVGTRSERFRYTLRLSVRRS